MSTHNIGFYEEKKQNYSLIIIKYNQIRTLSLLLNCLFNKFYENRWGDVVDRTLYISKMAVYHVSQLANLVT